MIVIGRQIADELFECVWPFCGIGALNRLKPAAEKNCKQFSITGFISSISIANN